MKPSNKSFLPVLILLFSACNAYSQVDSALAFYPLAKGNFWQYRSTHTDNGSTDRQTRYYSLEVVGDTLLPNGKTYFQIQNSGYQRAQPRFQRVDSSTSQVFAFDTAKGGSEVQIDSLRGQLHSRFSGCRLWWLYIRNTSIRSVDTQFCLGDPVPCRNYTAHPLYSGYYIDYTLARGLGLAFVRSGYWDDEYYRDAGESDTLIYAKVSGQEYGTLVSVLDRPQVAENFLLYQNYPNPFNPSTSIRWSTTRPTYAVMKIYDALGRELMTLVSAKVDAGSYITAWDASRYPSGVYFYRLAAEDRAETKRMVVMK
jgi:hypothetical protein